jgi:hypothetical protein
VLVESNQADLPSARSWREPSGTGHVRLDALRLGVPMGHASEVQGRVGVAVLNMPAGVLVAGKDAVGEAQLGFHCTAR